MNNRSMVATYTLAESTYNLSASGETLVITSNLVQIKPTTGTHTVSIREAISGITYVVNVNEVSPLLDSSQGIYCTKDIAETSVSLDITSYALNGYIDIGTDNLTSKIILHNTPSFSGGSAGVTSFNTRAGVVTLQASDVTSVWPKAAIGSLGVVSVGAGLAIDGSGVLSATGGGGGTVTSVNGRIGNVTIQSSDITSVWPTASAGTLGVIRIGNGLSIDENGIVSSSSSVTSVNSRTGAITILEADITSAIPRLTSVTDQSTLLAALTNYGVAYLDGNADFVVDNLTMPSGSKIYGNGTIRWNSDSLATNTLIVQSNCTIEGITFRRLQSATILSNAKVIIYTNPNSDNINFQNLTFIADLDLSYTTYENFMYFDQHCTAIRVKDCRSLYGGNVILAIDCKNSNFISNIFTSSSSAGFRFYGGKYNKIIGNKVDGRNVHNTMGAPGIAGQSTQVGINFLSFGFLGANTGVIGNQIIGNEIYGVSEEGIGIDTHGQTFADTFESKVLPIATVYSITQSDNRQIITLQESTTVNGVPSSTGWADLCYMVVLTGDAVGYIAPIITGLSTASGSTNTATIAISDANGIVPVANGDKLCITYGSIDNIISENRIDSTTTGISLWGSAWRNVISNNIVSAIDVGIQVAEVLGGPVTPNVNTYTLSYCGLNTIHNNTISLSYATQPQSVSRGWTPLVVGVWAYGTVSNDVHHHVGTEITYNKIYSSRNAIIGGIILGMNDPGYLSIFGGILAHNRFLGGGGFAVNRTTNLHVGPNFLHLTKENYRVSASASNTSLTEY